MHFPITGSRTDDFVVLVLVLIAGVALPLKFEVKWGWLLVAVAGYWAFRLLAPMAGH